MSGFAFFGFVMGILFASFAAGYNWLTVLGAWALSFLVGILGKREEHGQIYNDFEPFVSFLFLSSTVGTGIWFLKLIALRSFSFWDFVTLFGLALLSTILIVRGNSESQKRQKYISSDDSYDASRDANLGQGNGGG